MAVIRLPDKIFTGDYSDVVAPVSGDDGRALIWNQTAQRAEWVSVGGGGTPGGSTTQVQYNNGGAFAGHSGFTYDGAGKVTLASALVSPDIRPASNAVNSTGFSNASGTRVLSVDTANGRVGIGTTVTSGILHAKSTDNTPTIIGETSLASGNAWIYLKNPAQTWALLNRGNDSNSLNLWDVTNNNSVMKVFPFSGTFPVFSFNNSSYTGRPVAIKHSGNGQIALDNSTNLTWLVGTWNDTTYGLASGDFAIFPADQNGKIVFIPTTNGTGKMILDTSGSLTVSSVDVAGTVQMDGLRIDVTPTSKTITCTHVITFSANGVNYQIPCAPA